MNTLDLHGYYLHDAWNEFRSFVNDTYYLKEVQCRVITGHGSIQKELPYWANQIPKITRITPSHDGGSFTIHFKKLHKR